MYTTLETDSISISVLSHYGVSKPSISSGQKQLDNPVMSLNTGGREQMPKRCPPVCQMSSWLEAHSAPAWLAQGVALEHDEAVGVGHQKVKAKVEARPSPAVLRRHPNQSIKTNQSKPINPIRDAN